MSQSDRKEDEVRRLMNEVPQPTVPPDLAARAAERGRRMLRRRRAAQRVLWVLFAAALVAFVVWAAVAQPWVEPPADTSPPLNGW